MEIRKISLRRSRSVDDTELGHFTLLFCIGRQRNVQRFITRGLLKLPNLRDISGSRRLMLMHLKVISQPSPIVRKSLLFVLWVKTGLCCSFKILYLNMLLISTIEILKF